MKKNILLAACAAVFVCSCNCNCGPGGAPQKKDDSNQQMNSQKPKTGCCEAEKTEKSNRVETAKVETAEKVEVVQQNPAVAAPEVKVEKSEKSE